MVGRKVVTELVTTYLPTILLLLITFTTIFFDKDLFGDAIAVNLTIMLVMTTIFTSKIEELPPTSDLKMLDYWLIFCLVVPFLEVILRTAIECLSCSCDICEGKDANNSEFAGERTTEKEREGAGLVQQVSSSGEAAVVWVGTTKVAPQKVLRDIFLTKSHTSSHQVLTESQNRKTTGSTETSSKVNKEDSEARGLEREGVRAPACRKGTLKRGLKYPGERSLISVFIGPRSDHSLRLSGTHSLTH